ncbi:hypothetical protein A2954_07440 [Candidatus Roizmanbacteria bacterium RIFCSPLOWO2_01_FULL_37_12]|uniref:Uncharacterized protein n=1 Tax=Candidatus Roizmanbacteria bacterium RIFCSPLOWO2_01_FULL_37_12 TaxID=1802056 RepID=A0A1F7IEA1_9BACT|nr:MAG: hypothetical protein A3D76_04550 [Candidatus Roizmanbacteria bacterium RIFCSPHIGHO2_02_FULL_37_9b]OGK41682.1 MAG: hypothetical protein A2954_07440 [Candidatus Roizmanbacteria bacterium RIFCSPLOWO2_01_FULL_37_12]
MYLQKSGNLLKKAIFFLPILLILPIVIAFDSLIYFITKPSCLSCNTLPDFLRTASLSVFLLTNAGYKLKK